MCVVEEMPTEKPSDQGDPSPGNGERSPAGLKHRLASRFKRRPEEQDKKVGELSVPWERLWAVLPPQQRRWRPLTY